MRTLYDESDFMRVTQDEADGPITVQFTKGSFLHPNNQGLPITEEATIEGTPTTKTWRNADYYFQAQKIWSTGLSESEQLNAYMELNKSHHSEAGKALSPDKLGATVGGLNADQRNQKGIYSAAAEAILEMANQHEAIKTLLLCCPQGTRFAAQGAHATLTTAQKKDKTPGENLLGVAWECAAEELKRTTLDYVEPASPEAFLQQLTTLQQQHAGPNQGAKPKGDFIALQPVDSERVTTIAEKVNSAIAEEKARGPAVKEPPAGSSTDQTLIQLYNTALRERWGTVPGLGLLAVGLNFLWFKITCTKTDNTAFQAVLENRMNSRNPIDGFCRMFSNKHQNVSTIVLEESRKLFMEP